MSTKKSSTPRKSASSKPTREQLREQLAADIASILANPECPTALYNDISDNVCTWSSDYCNAVNETPDYIESCLLAHIANEEKRKGGAS